MIHIINIVWLICLFSALSCTNQGSIPSSPLTYEASNSSIQDSDTTHSLPKLNMYYDSLNTDEELLPCLIYNQYEGKVVYIDIWSTACYACIEEIPFAKALQNKMAHTNVAFVYFCCNSKPDVWRRMIHDHQMLGDHYLLNNDQYRLLIRKYKIVIFPTYLIFDKNGNLINSNAPRPSSTEIIKTFHQIL